MTKSATIKPFLRWAGGKAWLSKHLGALKEFNFNQYHEPFLGGGATFFHLKPQNDSYLSDLNQDLINTYVALRDDVNNVIDILKSYKNEREFYYEIREQKFTSLVENAAKFIYLNQTSFNGIYRVNLKGIYNVPYGSRSKEFLDENLLFDISKLLQEAEFNIGDFDIVKDNLNAGDLVFLDPPYTVSHNNNGFIKYNEKLFSLEDQYRLCNLIEHIKEQEAYFILTNAAHDKIREIFGKTATAHELSRANLIGGNNAQRGKTNELIFTNIPSLSNSL